MTQGTVLIVCTGNVCRSPYIEFVLRDALAGSGLEISSAGAQALAGRPIDPSSAVLLGQRGIDSSGFIARQLTPDMIREATLVLTATREHRAQVARTDASGLRKTFALVDFSDIVAQLEVENLTPSFLDPPGMTPLALLVSGAARHLGRVTPRPDGQADIVDPFKQDKKVFARMQQEVDAVLPPVVDALQRISARPIPHV